MRTLDTTSTLDPDLVRRADRKLCRYGSDLNRVLSAIVTARGLPPPLRTLSAVDESPEESARVASGDEPGNFRPVADFHADPFFDEPNATHLRRAIADMDAGRNVVFHDIVEETAPAHA